MSSEDYKLVLEVIMRTTFQLSDSSMDYLMQIRDKLSAEMARFLLSFTLVLESGNVMEIAEVVVDYAGKYSCSFLVSA